MERLPEENFDSQKEVVVPARVSLQVALMERHNKGHDHEKEIDWVEAYAGKFSEIIDSPNSDMLRRWGEAAGDETRQEEILEEMEQLLGVSE